VYEYVFLYTDDALFVGVEAELILGKRLACGDHNTEVVCDPSDPVIGEA
jgi:hypothetical protein